MVDEAAALANPSAEPLLTSANNQSSISKPNSAPSEARRRWKLLCLVKTSDTIADETARKDRLQERVDEWMNSMVWKMKEEETDCKLDLTSNTKKRNGMDNSSLPNGSSGDGESTLPSYLQRPIVQRSPRGVKLKEEGRQEEVAHELAQQERIRNREQIEKEKERELILSGKMSMDKSLWKDDPVLRLHRDLDKVQRKVSKDQNQHQQHQKRHKKSSVSQNPPMSGLKLKWFSAMKQIGGKPQPHRESLDDGDISQSDDSTETVVARLVYDEASDQLTTVVEELPSKSGNPIFEAFKEATDVDDLYRIAEIWVNPPTYFGFR